MFTYCTQTNRQPGGPWSSARCSAPAVTQFLLFAMPHFSIKVKLTKQYDLTRKLLQNVTTTVKKSFQESGYIVGPIEIKTN